MVTDCYFCGNKTVVTSYQTFEIHHLFLDCDCCKVCFFFQDSYIEQVVYQKDLDIDSCITTDLPCGKSYISEDESIIDLPAYFLCDLDNLKKIDMIKIFS